MKKTVYSPAALGCLLILCLGLALNLALAGPAAAADDTVLVLGRAALGDNEAQAKDLAVEDALARAVGDQAIAGLDPAALRDGLAILDREVLTKARQFVSTYTLKAAVPGQGTMLVLVAVKVDRAALIRTLIKSGLKPPTARLPKALVLVAQEAAPGRPAMYWWSGVPGLPAAPGPVARVLEALGVEVVQPRDMEGRVPVEMREAVLNEDQARELARLCGAGLVLVGRVRTYPLISPEGGEPAPAAQLMALTPESPEPLAVVEETGPVYHALPGPGAGQAVEEAVEAATRRLLSEVAAGRSVEQVAAPAEVELTVTGIRSLADLYGFERVLRDMPELVESVRRSSVAPGRAVLVMKLKAPSSRLADELLLQDFGGQVANVVDVQPSRLEVILAPRRELREPAVGEPQTGERPTPFGGGL